MGRIWEQFFKTYYNMPRMMTVDDVQGGVTASPFHCNCRTFQAPYFDENFGVPQMKAARNAEGKTIYVPDDMSYKEWEKKFVKGD